MTASAELKAHPFFVILEFMSFLEFPQSVWNKYQKVWTPLCFVVILLYPGIKGFPMLL